jgi:hypothetical protein
MLQYNIVKIISLLVLGKVVFRRKSDARREGDGSRNQEAVEGSQDKESKVPKSVTLSADSCN